MSEEDTVLQSEEAEGSAEAQALAEVTAASEQAIAADAESGSSGGVLVTVPSSLGSLAQLGKPLPFLHASVDRFCGRKEVSLAPFAAEGVDMEGLSTDVQSLLGGIVGQELDETAVDELLGSHSAKDALLACLEARRDELRVALARRSGQLSRYLQDFDWSLRLTMSTEKLSTLREPVVLLTLSLGSPDQGEQSRRVHLELSRAELDKLIASCEEVGGVLRKLPSSPSSS